MVLVPSIYSKVGSDNIHFDSYYHNILFSSLVHDRTKDVCIQKSVAGLNSSSTSCSINLQVDKS